MVKYIFNVEDIKQQLDEMGYIWNFKLADGTILTNEMLSKTLKGQIDLEVTLKINTNCQGRKTLHIDHFYFYTVEDGPSGSGESRPAYRYKGLDFTRQWRERLIKTYAFEYFEICKASLNSEIESLEKKNSKDEERIRKLEKAIFDRNLEIKNRMAQIEELNPEEKD